jgi:hypothetical protein
LSLDKDDPASVRRKNLRELAETCVDAGANDIQLIVALSNVKDTEGQLQKRVSEMEALEVAAENLEQAAREREASLRFAIGELSFAQRHVTRGSQSEADKQIKELEQRLLSVNKDLDRDLKRLTERAIALAAERAQVEERLEAAYAALEQQLDRTAKKFASDPAVAAMLDRIASVSRPAPPPLPPQAKSGKK